MAEQLAIWKALASAKKAISIMENTTFIVSGCERQKAMMDEAISYLTLALANAVLAKEGR